MVNFYSAYITCSNARGTLQNVAGIKGAFTLGPFLRFNVLKNLISLFDSMGKIKVLKS